MYISDDLVTLVMSTIDACEQNMLNVLNEMRRDLRAQIEAAQQPTEQGDNGEADQG